MPNQILWIVLLLLVAVVIIRLVLRQRRTGALPQERIATPDPIESTKAVAGTMIEKSAEKARDSIGIATQTGAILADKALDAVKDVAAKEEASAPAPVVAKAEAPISTPAKAAPPAAIATPARTSIGIAGAVGEPDNLLLLKGVGPKLNTLLGTLGITRFDQIAAWSQADIETVDGHLGTFKGRIVRDSWIEQADLLANGRIDAFEARFGKIDGAKP